MAYQTFVGIDIGKFRHAVAICDSQGAPVTKPFEVMATSSGWKVLRERLATLPHPIVVGMEATGHYFLPFYERLAELAEVDPVVFNPLQVAAYRKQGIREQKTDKLDSLLIARMLKIGEISPYQLNDPSSYALKQLTRLRSDLVDSAAVVKRKVIALLDKIFPEYRESFTNIFNTSSTAILSQTALPEEIAALDTQKLTTLVEELSRKKKGAATVAKLQLAARETIGLKTGASAMALAVKILLAQIDDIETRVQALEGAIRQLVDQKETAILTSIPGISHVTAATILAEIGDFGRFGPKDTAEKLVALAGIDPRIKESGIFKGKSKMSKRGSPYLRRTLRQAAFVAALTSREPMFAVIYERQKERGKHHEVALSHVAHKLVHVLAALLKKQRPYRADYQSAH